MAFIVVDTNVAMVASGTDDPPLGCVRACQRRLSRIADLGEDIVVVDAGWGILGEYCRNLGLGGRTRAGGKFLKWVLTNRANPARCVLVGLTPDATRGFAEFPDDPRLTSFDRADRKFVAVARAHGDNPPILQALDSEWWGYGQALLDNDVTVEFLCPTEIRALHAKKHGTP